MNKQGSILFDLDGVLWDTIDSCVKSLADIKNKYDDIKYDITSDTVKRLMGKSFNDIKVVYYGYLSEKKQNKYAKEAFNHNIDNLLKNGGNLYPNMIKTIKKLSKKYRLFIVSNCIEGYIESFLRTSGLHNYFEDYECSGKTKLTKGENIKLVMKRNNIDKNAYYVGDTISDKKAADFANIPFIYASYGFGNVEEYEFRVNSIEDILNINNL